MQMLPWQTFVECFHRHLLKHEHLQFGLFLIMYLVDEVDFKKLLPCYLLVSDMCATCCLLFFIYIYLILLMHM